METLLPYFSSVKFECGVLARGETQQARAALAQIGFLPAES